MFLQLTIETFANLLLALGIGGLFTIILANVFFYLWRRRRVKKQAEQPTIDHLRLPDRPASSADLGVDSEETRPRFSVTITKRRTT